MTVVTKKKLREIPFIRRLLLYLSRLAEYKEKALLLVSSFILIQEIKRLLIIIKKKAQVINSLTKKRAPYCVSETINFTRFCLNFRRLCFRGVEFYA